ncbi:glycoside hydrolase family 6 protein [Nocardioides salsibiostraticola]
MLRPSRLVVLLGALVFLGGCSGSVAPVAPTPERVQTVVANPALETAAVRAEAEEREADSMRLRRLSEIPTGIWLTPERFPEAEAAAYVEGIVAEATGSAGSSEGDSPKVPTIPVFVLYGIPDRDCTGEFSAGGLSQETYLPWVQAIATAAGEASVVVLEPDALASATSCAAESTRVELIEQAVGILAEAEVTTYVDAGHSAWVPAADMADLLRQVGVERVRGFATNVANYQPQLAERSYAQTLSALLDDAHYVIDTGRNGASTRSGEPVSEWCNPSGQALGSPPEFVQDEDGLDGWLWIKPPAESDGPCNGGPPAGELWVERSLELAVSAGW